MATLAETPAAILRLINAHYRSAQGGDVASGSVEQLLGHLLDTELALACSTWTPLLQESPGWQGRSSYAWQAFPKPPLAELVQSLAALRRGNLLLLHGRPNRAADDGPRTPYVSPFEIRLVAAHDLVHLEELRALVHNPQAAAHLPPAGCRLPSVHPQRSPGTATARYRRGRRSNPDPGGSSV